MEQQAIHTSVQKRYGAIALQDSSCCGNGSDCGCNSNYDTTLLQSVPENVLSLGCGDPITIASLQPGETVLDLGSGAGLDCFLAAKQVGETGQVIGVDMTLQMLIKARANQEKLGLQNVEFREGYIEKLPVRDNTVDVVMSNCVISLAPDKAAVFQEAFRVLKPGGRLSISDMVTEGDFTPEQRADAELWASCVTGAIDVNQYTQLIEAAGFVDVQVVDKAGTSTGLADAPRFFSARVTGRKPQ